MRTVTTQQTQQGKFHKAPTPRWRPKDKATER